MIARIVYNLHTYNIGIDIFIIMPDNYNLRIKFMIISNFCFI